MDVKELRESVVILRDVNEDIHAGVAHLRDLLSKNEDTLDNLEDMLDAIEAEDS